MYGHATKHTGYRFIGRDAKSPRMVHPRKNRIRRHRRGLRAVLLSLTVAAGVLGAVLLAASH